MIHRKNIKLKAGNLLLALTCLILIGQKSAYGARHGLAGGSGDDWEISRPSNNNNFKISSIRVAAGDYVDSIELLGRDSRTGQEYSLGKAGGRGGTTHHIGFGQDERLIGIYGRSGATIDHIYFQTNYRTYGPYGQSTGGDPYRYEGEIVGLWGRQGPWWFHHVIKAIGVITR